MEEKITKANKGISLIKNVYRFVPRKTLLLIYKAYIRPHLDYADVIYDQPHNESFCKRIETVQYNACLAITGAIRGTNRERLYNELGLESLRDRRKCRRLILFFKIFNKEAPAYLSNLLPPNVSFRTGYVNALRPYVTRSKYFENSFFPNCVNEWNSLSPEIRTLDSLSKFKKVLLSFFRPTQNSIFNTHDAEGLKLLTRLRLEFSHLKEHKFRHRFADTVLPFCDCGMLEAESSEHFLLRCPTFSNERNVLLDSLSIPFFSDLSDSEKSRILLFGHESLSFEMNHQIILNTITFLKASKRFDRPLLQ